MTIGLYVVGDSPVHRLPAGAKVALLAVAGVVVFMIADRVWLVAILAAAVGVLALSRAPLRDTVRQLRPLVWILAAVLVAHAVLTSWTLGLVIVLRFAVLLLLALAVTFTTRISDMVAVVERLLAPLALVGANPEKISLTLSLALRFLPMLAERVHEVREAQKARGRERDLIALMVPLVLKTLRMAGDLTDAIEARGFDPEPRSRRKRPQL